MDSMDMLDVVVPHYWDELEVTASKTQANRFFHVRCKRCQQYSYGEWGTWAIAPEAGLTAKEGARDNLEKFFKLKEVPSQV